MDLRKKDRIYIVDLTKIETDGPFPCPKCGAIISPDDHESRTVIKTIVKNDDVESMLLKCQNCKSKIRLTGFQSPIQETI